MRPLWGAWGQCTCTLFILKLIGKRVVDFLLVRILQLLMILPIPEIVSCGILLYFYFSNFSFFCTLVRIKVYISDNLTLFARSKIAIFDDPRLRLTPDGGVPLVRSP